METVNVTRVNSIKHQALMLTQDENIVDVTLTVQWVIDNPIDFVTKVREPENSLENAAESALRHVVGSTQMDNVITEGRAAIAVEVAERVQTYLEPLRNRHPRQQGEHRSKRSAEAGAGCVRRRAARKRRPGAASSTKRPHIAKASCRRRAATRRRRFCRPRRIAIRSPRARKARRRRFSKLLAEYRQAKQVTRDRLYIDAMESVLSHSTKILVDVKGANNMMYLPLDKLMQQQSQSMPSSTPIPALP